MQTTEEMKCICYSSTVHLIYDQEIFVTFNERQYANEDMT